MYKIYIFVQFSKKKKEEKKNSKIEKNPILEAEL